MSLTRFRLYTHYVTPTFAKLNLLGILHTVRLAKTTVTLGVKTRGYNYAVVVGVSTDQNRLLESLAGAIERERGNLLRIEETKEEREEKGRKWFVPRGGTKIGWELLRGVAEKYGEKMAKEGQPWPELSADSMGAVLGEAFHDRRRAGGGSPSLALAPELGKYSTASIPHPAATHPYTTAGSSPRAPSWR